MEIISKTFFLILFIILFFFYLIHRRFNGRKINIASISLQGSLLIYLGLLALEGDFHERVVNSSAEINSTLSFGVLGLMLSMFHFKKDEIQLKFFHKTALGVSLFLVMLLLFFKT